MSVSVGRKGEHPTGIVAAASVAAGMVWLGTADVAIVLPRIQSDLNASFSELQWINNVSFTIVLSSTVVAAGRLVDSHGGERILGWGLAVFAFASMLAGVAWTPPMLLVGRALQGLGGAMILPASLAIVVSIAPGHRARAIGVRGATVSLMEGGAPAIAGVFAALGYWRGIFWINLPLAGFVYLFSRRGHAPLSSRPTPGLPRTSTVFLAATVIGISVVVIEGDEWGWASTWTASVVVAAIAVGAAFLYVEWRSDDPMIRLSLFRNPLFSGSISVILIVNAAFSGLMLYSAWLLHVVGEGVFESGLAFMPGAFALASGAIIAGRPLDHLRLTEVGVGGPVLLTFALGLAINQAEVTTSTGVLIVFVLAGAGAGIAVTFTATCVVLAAPAHESGAVSGVFIACAAFGVLLGTAVTGAVFESVAEPRFVSAASARGVSIPSGLAGQISGILSGSPAAERELAAFSETDRATVEQVARDAFVHGVQITMVVLAVLVAAAVGIVWVSARRRYIDPSNQSG